MSYNLLDSRPRLSRMPTPAAISGALNGAGRSFMGQLRFELQG
jgi:hypothetical protein